MIVCMCAGVSERDVFDEIERGCSCFTDLQERLDVGVCCGRCADYCKDMMASHCRNCGECKGESQDLPFLMEIARAA